MAERLFYWKEIGWKVVRWIEIVWKVVGSILLVLIQISWLVGLVAVGSGGYFFWLQIWLLGRICHLWISLYAINSGDADSSVNTKPAHCWICLYAINSGNADSSVNTKPAHCWICLLAINSGNADSSVNTRPAHSWKY